ncbi:MAG: hypothetical protein AAF402_06445 [Pseudomonadota bacterium]
MTQKQMKKGNGYHKVNKLAAHRWLSEIFGDVDDAGNTEIRLSSGLFRSMARTEEPKYTSANPKSYRGNESLPDLIVSRECDGMLVLRNSRMVEFLDIATINSKGCRRKKTDIVNIKFELTIPFIVNRA